jgi:hypothetical protein
MMRNQVQYDEEGFKVACGDEIKQVAYHNVSKDLLTMHKLHKVHEFLEHGGKIRASRLDNGEYVLESHVDGLGGGPGWAIVTALVGYPLVGLAALGTLIVTLPSGPGCVVAAAAVATGGTHLVTEAVIVVAAIPTP